jgi:hypothetical protein
MAHDLEGKAKYFPMGGKLHDYRNPKILAFSVIFVFIRGAPLIETEEKQ